MGIISGVQSIFFSVNGAAAKPCPRDFAIVETGKRLACSKEVAAS